MTNAAKHAGARKIRCASRTRDDSLVEVARRRRRRRDRRRRPGLRGLADRVAAHGGTMQRREPGRRRDDAAGRAAVRVVIAEDSVLLREGCAMLRDAGDEVVAAVGDADALLAAVAAHRPDLAIVDVRMPPTHTDEGARAARAIRERHPSAAVWSSPSTSRPPRLDRCAGRRGFGYLLKDRVLEVATSSRRRAASPTGGSALDPEVVRALLGAATAATRSPASPSASARCSG